MLSRLRFLAGLAFLFLADATPPVPYQFTDSAQSAGIRFTHVKGNHLDDNHLGGKKAVATILEEAGPGVCVADFDGDGWQDLYLVNGRALSSGNDAARPTPATNALYRNNRDGTFTDVTAQAGVPGDAYGLGCVWGDYDNDGHPDLYVTQYGRNILYHNNGNGTFTDVTAKAHVDGLDFGTTFHTGAVFFDYDRDGLLDLYAGGYVDFGPQSQQTCSFNGVESSCPPQAYPGTAAVLYHNNGDGTFTNTTKAAKIFQPAGKNLAVGSADYDNDGWPDLFVANDGKELYLYHNEHNGTFQEVALSAGVALNEDGGTMAAMCISLGDFLNTGLLDLYVSDFQEQGDHLWRNTGKGSFEDVTRHAGLGAATVRYLSFGGGFLDYDNDGWLDLFIANGHVYPGAEDPRRGSHYKQRNLLFHNDHNGVFSLASQSNSPAFSVPHLGRGVAFADFQNHGSLDIVVANNDDPPLFLRNSGGPNHFLTLQLIGQRSNRDAIGAKIRVKANGLAQLREIQGGGSYLSQSDLRAHFGLGTAPRVDSIEIDWPSGLHQQFLNLPADRFYTLREGATLVPNKKPA